MNVIYRINFSEPSTHFYNVEIEVKNIKEDFIEFHLPVWRPGRYLILDFAGDVQQFSAKNFDNSGLEWKKINKTTWKIKLNGNGLKLNYKIFANEFNLRTKGLDEEHAFINPVCLFMYSEYLRNNKIELEIIPPLGWEISTGLKNSEDKNKFVADNYDHFADCPLEIGIHLKHRFIYEQKEYEIALFGSDKMDFLKFENDFKKIIDVNGIFWGHYPYEKYLIIIHCSETSGGGTEHINSTVVGCKPFIFENDESYKDFLRLISHEYFHTWNIKQFRPQGLTPYNYICENYTEELWIAEGGTSYYDGLMLLRTGHYNQNDIFRELGSYINEERKRPGNKIQSLAESSYDAWIKFWKPHQQKYISETDYYRKGSYVAALLDLEIRNASENRHSLDDVFRTLYKNYPLNVKGYTNYDFIQIAMNFSGTDLTGFMNDYIYGVKPLQWEKFLIYAGLEIYEYISEKDEMTYKIKKIVNPNTLQKQIFEDWLNLAWQT